MGSSDCPARERLADYVLGKLSGEVIESLSDHVSTCPACQTALATLDNLSDELLSAVRQGSSDGIDSADAELDQLVGVAEAIVREALGERNQPFNRAGAAEATGAAGDELQAIGQYRILEKLGQGGMGAVYRALHPKLKRVVAVKVIAPARMGNPQAVARFRREMEAVGRLEHPAVVRAYDAGEADGKQFLVMELVEGVDFSQLVSRLEPLSTPDACEMVRQAAEGLQYVHERGLVHRDIKPSNLVLTRDGQVKILDLGLALLQASPALGEEITSADQVMGTADYMAPEQISDSHAVDIRADVYSLGCTLYKLLTGRAPFTGPQYRSSFDKMTGHVRDQVPPITESRPDLPEELSAVIDRMLAKSPDDRFATPAEVVEAMAPFVGGCDLPGLLAEAEEKWESSGEGDGSRGATNQCRSSALVGTYPSHRPKLQPRLPGARRRRKPRILITALVLSVLIVTGVVLFLATNYGTVKIELDDAVANAEITVDGDTIAIDGLAEPMRLKAGEHHLKVTAEGFESHSEWFAVKRGKRKLLEVSLDRKPKKPRESPLREREHREGAPSGDLAREERGWPHEGQNLWCTNFLAAASLPVAGNVTLERAWFKENATTIRTADLDGLGDLEVVYLEDTGQARSLVALSGDGTQLWRRDPVADSELPDPRAHVYPFYDVADLDGNGDYEVVLNVNCDAGWTKDKRSRILIYEGDGTLRKHFAVVWGAWALPLVADVTGDGKPEIVAGVADYKGAHGAYVYTSDGVLLGRTLAGEGLWVEAAADIDQDGVNEALFTHFGSHNRQPEVNGIDDMHSHVLAVEGDGSSMWVRRLGTCAASAAVTDLTGDGTVDIIAFRQQSPTYPGDNEIHLLDNATGATLAKYVGPANQEWNSWVMADLDDDGFTELALGAYGSGHVRVLDSTLKLILVRTWPSPASVLAGNDLDGDGAVELVVGVDTTVHVVDGHLNTKWSCGLPGSVRDAIVSDLDYDGVNEILAETTAGLSVLRLSPKGAEKREGGRAPSAVRTQPDPAPNPAEEPPVSAAIERQVITAIVQAEKSLEKMTRPAAIVAMYLDTEDPQDSLPQGYVEYRCYSGGGGYSGIVRVPLRQAWTRFERISPGRDGNRRIQLDPGPPYEILSREVVVAAGEVTNLGRVVLKKVKFTASIHGTVKDWDGNPLPDVQVVGGTRQTTADAEGRYVLDGFGLEVVSLKASKSGYFGGTAQVSIRNMDQRNIAQDLTLFRPLRVKLKYVIGGKGSDSLIGPDVEEGTLELTVNATRIDLSEIRCPSKHFHDFTADTHLCLSLRTGELTIDNSRAPVFFHEAAPEVTFESITQVGYISYNSQHCPPLKEGSMILIRGFAQGASRGVSNHCLKVLVEELAIE